MQNYHSLNHGSDGYRNWFEPKRGSKTEVLDSDSKTFFMRKNYHSLNHGSDGYRNHDSRPKEEQNRRLRR